MTIRKHHVCWLLMGLSLSMLVTVALLLSWVKWSDWPDPQQGPVFSNPDAIVILGGGDKARWAHSLKIANDYPSLPVIVTGDGGAIVFYLKQEGLPESRIVHEQEATSTVENAKFTRQILEALGAQRVLLVTNWFHQPRSKAIFTKYQAEREFCVSIAPKPDPMQPWDREAHQRERLAALHNLFFHGIWSW